MMKKVKTEVKREKHLEAWARRRSDFFTKKVKRALLCEIDNVVLNWNKNGPAMAQGEQSL